MKTRVPPGITFAAAVAFLVATPGALLSQGAGGIPWTRGPVTGKLGDVAQVDVPQNCRFTSGDGVKAFMDATENPMSGDEVGVLLCPTASADSSVWFVVFSYRFTGYVKDDEKASLDSDKILASLKEGNEAGNAERRKLGWETIDIIGWDAPPFYDANTNNLTWAVRAKTERSTEETLNRSVRLLGRGGVMEADVVASATGMRYAVPEFDSILTGYEFVAGQKYSEWQPGDKVAEFGLTALIAGGAGVAAAKLGFFGKAWKLILAALLVLKKGIIVVIVAVGALLKKLFGKKEPATPTG